VPSVAPYTSNLFTPELPARVNDEVTVREPFNHIEFVLVAEPVNVNVPTVSGL
jgi:hypothetical protein